ncbi:multicopper oxidase domain-containing protein [bacterium]|nr:multicopper oxidase domain-containing protein [bacterium]
MSQAKPTLWRMRIRSTFTLFIFKCWTVITRFDGFRERYVWHCHILEHEDNEMRIMDVI